MQQCELIKFDEMSVVNYGNYGGAKGSNLTTVMGSKVNLGWSIQKSTTVKRADIYRVITITNNNSATIIYSTSATKSPLKSKLVVTG